MGADEQWAWLLSTIAQTFGALIGIGGMLAVFKLQRIHDMIGKQMDKIEPHMQAVVPEKDIPTTSPEDWVDAWWKVQDTKEFDLKRGKWARVNTASVVIQINTVIRSEIKQDFYLALRATLLLIFISILGLFNCKLLSPNIISRVFISFFLTLIIVLTMKVLLDFYKSLIVTKLHDFP
jgi:hypothetical protein